jgi:hypothetical protein
VKNLVNRQYLLFPQTGRHSKFGSILCKIRGEKHYTAFVKVVEGSEIYNFPIHHFVHFYSKFLTKTWSNVASPTRCVAPAPRRASPRRAVASVPMRARHLRTALRGHSFPMPLRASRGRLALRVAVPPRRDPRSDWCRLAARSPEAPPPVRPPVTREHARHL